MNLLTRPKIVVLGMMTKMPVAGVVWQTVHYLVGLQRLGYEVYYVEAHGRTPSMLMEREDEDGSAKAADFIATVMRRFDIGHQWAFQALHHDGQCYGLSQGQLRDLYASAELIINLHGGTEPLQEHGATGRLVYVETDPVQLQIELHDNVQKSIEFLEPHRAFFTFAENYGHPDCLLPVSERFRFHPTRQPVVTDFWQGGNKTAGEVFTTIGNWKQPWRPVRFRGHVYHWSKHREFLKFSNLPTRVDQPIELALSGCDEPDRRLLEGKGWRVRSALDLSMELDTYREYIARSRAEFTVAKDQNVRLRTGWFSDRSATYLVAGKPVITQDTGFGTVLPTGVGLFAFSTIEEITQAIESINGDYETHRSAAAEIGREFFDATLVLSRLLDDVGISPRSSMQLRTDRTVEALPAGLDLVLLSRWPAVLPEETVRSVLSRPIPTLRDGSSARPEVSIIIPVLDNLVFTRLCLDSLLLNTESPEFEIVVVDNGSSDGTPAYLRALSAADPRVQLILNDRNHGFARAVNQGLEAAWGDALVILNNDTIVPPGWLERLTSYLGEGAVGLVGPVTNRAGNEAEVEVPYRTYGEFLQFARRFHKTTERHVKDVRTTLLFCAALRRDVYDKVGPLDERFQVGMFEDDDYAVRVRMAGYRVVFAQDVFVHHFGQATIGKLAATAEYGELFHANRRRFEEKWGVQWQPHERQPNEAYAQLVDQIRKTVLATVPAHATIAVVSKGDERLLQIDDRRAWHFPQETDGSYAGHHPASTSDAIEQLEGIREKGAHFLVVPKTNRWWLDFYGGLKEHLESRYKIMKADDTCAIYALNGREPKVWAHPEPTTSRSKGEGAMARTKHAPSLAELRDEIIRLAPWHLDVEVTPDISTRAFLDSARALEPGPVGPVSFIDPKKGFTTLMRKVYPDGLAGRSVLDCACNCGGYLFWAKELGAGDCVGFDVRQHWIDQAKFLLENRNGSTEGIRFEECDLYDLPTLALAPADVTLFKGIFYHLPDPIHGLKIAADLTRELLIVNTATNSEFPDGQLVASRESTSALMSGVHGLNWFPTGPQVLIRILKWAGFVRFRCTQWLKENNPGSGKGRLELLASRREDLLDAFEPGRGTG
jgi:GT2 family glycosyltransferase/SAM-dependent methyltransferase